MIKFIIFDLFIFGKGMYKNSIIFMQINNSIFGDCIVFIISECRVYDFFVDMKLICV